MTGKLVTLGVIIGAHGVRGDVRVKSFTAEAEDIFAYGPLKGEDGVVLITPTSVRAGKNHFIVSPEEQRQKEDWDALKGTKLCIERDCLPETDDDEIYVDDLVGLHVINGANEVIGTVKAVLNHGASDLLEIMPTTGGKPVLVPFTHADVPDIDLVAGRVSVATFDLWADQSGKPEDQD
ncbi:MAG: ribosome maturation factor RimM [Pseudomonadota bacterium]